MPVYLRGLFSVAGRVVLCAIFLASALGEHIPKYQETLAAMEKPCACPGTSPS